MRFISFGVHTRSGIDSKSSFCVNSIESKPVMIISNDGNSLFLVYSGTISDADGDVSDLASDTVVSAFCTKYDQVSFGVAVILVFVQHTRDVAILFACPLQQLGCNSRCLLFIVHTFRCQVNHPSITTNPMLSLIVIKWSVNLIRSLLDITPRNR